jgi:hypothetical protein
VYGLARRPPRDLPGLIPVVADLLDEVGLQTALAAMGNAPTHVFITTWMRQDTEAENIRVNAALVRNLLDALSPKKSAAPRGAGDGPEALPRPLRSLCQSGTLPDTPLRESQPRLPLENFYYAQEDEVYAAAERDRFTWTVHRPHTSSAWRSATP